MHYLALMHQHALAVFSSCSAILDDLQNDNQPYTDQAISNLTCFNSDVEKLFVCLNVSKADGPYGMSALMLREAAPAMSGPLTIFLVSHFDLVLYYMLSGSLPILFRFSKKVTEKVTNRGGGGGRTHIEKGEGCSSSRLGV